MVQYTLDEIFNMAGIYRTDSDLERDLKLDAWLNGRKYRIVTMANLPVPRAQQDIEFLIIKEK